MISMSQLGQLGRLGNQMFQYAALYAAARRAGVRPVIPPCELAESLRLPSTGMLSREAIQARIQHTWSEPSFSHHTIPVFDPTVHTDIRGYFQSEKYFAEFGNDIAAEFEPRFRMPDPTGRVAIHVRRTDYLTKEDYHPTCSIDYYRKAMAMFPENQEYFTFSDDPVWCAQNGLPGIVIRESAVRDMMAMSMCSGWIIANSSFSWWAAWLGRRRARGGIVVAPQQWFGPKGPQDVQDLVPEGWVRL